MPSNARIAPILAVALALAGCVGGGGCRDAPTIALPSGPGMPSEAPVDRALAYQPPLEQPQSYRASADSATVKSWKDHRRPASAPANLLPAPTQDLPPDAPQGAGPRGTSGEVREDVVGYASLMSDPGDARFGNVAVGVAHPSLPPGGFVEVTSLDTGRTIVAMIVATSDAGSVVALSPGAVQVLGIGDRAAVRVRTINVSPQDQVALRSGQTASPRLDAPPALLTALRRKLPVRPTRDRRVVQPKPIPTKPTPTRPAPPASRTAPVVRPSVRSASGFVVQVAALSSAERAAALARELGGHVVATGSLYRVQIGPFAEMATAQRARDGVARRGYGDARITHTE